MKARWIVLLALILAGCSADGEESEAFDVVDNNVPTWPSGAALTWEQVSNEVGTLRWQSARDDRGIGGYTLAVDGVSFGFTPGGSTSADISLAWPGPMSFTVRAFDPSLNLSSELKLTVELVEISPPAVWPSGASLLATDATESSVRLSWTASTLGNATYVIYSDGAEVGAVAGATSLIIDELSPWTQYSFQVSARTSPFAESPGPTALVKTLDSTAPTWTPGTLEAVDIADDRLTLDWPAAIDNVSIARYRVFRDQVPIGETTGTTTSLVVDSLDSQVDYNFSVEAEDPSGRLSEALSLIVATTDEAAPSWPAGAHLLASKITPNTLMLGWTPATDNVGVATYVVYHDGAEVAVVSATSHLVVGLAAWTEYEFEVSASDGANNATVGPSVTVRTADAQSPVWPTDAALTVSNVSANGASLQWPAATDDVGVTNYRVLVDESVVFEGSAGGTTAVSGLLPWTNYSATVEAHDAAGNVATLSTTFQTTDDSAPFWPAPATLEATTVLPDRVALTWSSADDDVGVTQYRVEWDDGQMLVSGDLTATIVTGLTAWTDYMFFVSASDAAGTWTVGPTLELQTPDNSAPQWPVNAAVSTTVASATSLNVNWPSATDDVGIASYRVSVDGGPLPDLAADASGVLVTGLTPGQPLLVTVVARDAAANASTPLSTTTQTTDDAAPNWPGGATLQADASSTEIALSWPIATDDDGVTGYRVRIDDTEVGTVLETTYVVSDLTPQTEYTASVEARDTSGNWSAPLTAIVSTTSGYDPGFRRLSQEQFNRSLSDLHGLMWRTAFEKTDNSESWLRNEDIFYALFTTQTYGYWLDYRRAYPPDNWTASPSEPRGGYRRLDQVVYDEHVTAWIGAIMSLGANYETWVGHVLLFGACLADNAAGVTNYPTTEATIDACVDSIIVDFGRRAFRRPLTEDEVVFFRGVFDDSEAEYADVTFSHWAGYGWLARGLRNVLAVINASPEFLYRVEVGDEDGNLTAYELASRLSYHFWNTMPDEALFASAADGSLMTEAGYAAEVDRLSSDPRARLVVDEFYRDYFRVQDIPDINEQDGPTGYHGGPTWTGTNGQHSFIVEAMQSELANLGKWYGFDHPGTYEDLFRSNLHLLECSPPPWDPDVCYGAGPYSQWSLGFDGWDGWDGVSEPVSMPEPERVGLLTRIALLAHDTALARPIRRGIYIREALLCDPVPPPENCDVVKPPEIDVYMTVREKVEAITEVPGTTCAGCHTTFINGFGHALGHFSSKGNYWETERMFSDTQNAAGDYWYTLLPEDQWEPIDTTASTYFQGQLIELTGPQDAADTLAASGRLEWCFAREYFRFSLGRTEFDTDLPAIEGLAEQMRQGMTLYDAFKSIAYIPQFRTLETSSAPEGTP
ncbi:MAG: chitodextrinase [Myxococcota bacterium]|jgi:chitodextrinase